MADIASDFITLARQLASHKSFKKAFDMYMCAFEKQPCIKKRYEFEFRAVLSRMNEELAAVDNEADIFGNFKQAIKMYPGSVELLNDIGRYLYHHEYFSEALGYFEKALNIDHSFVTIEKNLNNVKCSLFPRSQFRYLNDRIRNDAYRRAIRSCVTPAVDSVLVIDTGSGLLALYANECNPVAIRACQGSATMARLAERVMQDNNAQEVSIINKPFGILNHNDIYATRSVLLTDMIDSGLFGEYLLQTIRHAWENLLEENGKIIPGRAEYFVAGINCDKLDKKYKLCRETKHILNVSHMNVHTTTDIDETYCSEDVNTYDDLKYMSEPQSLLKIDFNNYYDICAKLQGIHEPYVAKLTAKEDGEMNMIVGWFNLYLTEDIMITSDPRSETKANAWQQAVFFDFLPKKLRKDETANVPFLTYGGRLTTLLDTNTAISRISPETLAFLNDFEYMDMIRKSIATVCVHLGQTVVLSNVDMVDLSPFPLFGVLMMKRGANSLICHVKYRDDKMFLLAVLKANKIPEDKVTILVSDSWSQDVFKGKKFHVIFNNIIDFNGDMDLRRHRIIKRLKNFHLRFGGLCLPASVTIMGQLINSKWLEINNRVLDENVDFRIAKHVNRYQVSQAVNIDMARMKYETLSEEFAIGCCENLQSEVINVTVTEDGECNAVLCWYKVQLLDEWNEIYTYRSNSFVESMAYMVSPNVKVFCGDQANLLNCIDPNGSFKVMLDMES